MILNKFQILAFCVEATNKSDMDYHAGRIRRKNEVQKHLENMLDTF
jgi:hypothetical protein